MNTRVEISYDTHYNTLHSSDYRYTFYVRGSRVPAAAKGEGKGMIRDNERMYAVLVSREYQDTLFQSLPQFAKMKESSIACCPFHDDVLPTFVIYPDRPEFFCFVCSARGDWLKYLQEKKGLGFSEAVDLLSRDSGIQVNNFDKAQWEKELNRSMLLELAAGFFTTQLFAPEGETVLHYLYNRGYAMGEVEGSAFGYYPGFEQMKKYLLSQGVAERFLEDELSGIWKTDAEEFRLSIPYRDSSGRLMGFIGRDITAQGQAAYRPLTDLSTLEDVPFLMNRAVAHEEIIIVEGLLDALLVDRIGFKPAVAIGKEGLSTGMLETIASYGIKRCLLCLGNGAGKNELTLEAAKLLRSRGIEAAVLAMREEYQDLDHFIRSTDLHDLRKLIKKPVSINDYSAGN